MIAPALTVVRTQCEEGDHRVRLVLFRGFALVDRQNDLRKGLHITQKHKALSYDTASGWVTGRGPVTVTSTLCIQGRRALQAQRAIVQSGDHK